MNARRCGKCGNASESHELMQLNTPLPWNSILKSILDEVPGKRNDIPKNKKHQRVLVLAS